VAQNYRVGIVGCGRIAGAHVAGYQSDSRYEIVSAADVRASAARELCERYGIPRWYEDYEEMLRTEQLDVVSICTWPSLHAEMTAAAARSGVKAVLCEKPMAPSLGDAESMVEVCRDNDVRLAVGHQHRFDPSWVEAKGLIASGAIGQPVLAMVRVQDGLLNNGTHYIDGVRYMLGDPQPQWVMAQVERRTDRYERGEPIEDRLSGVVSFAGGAEMLVEVDMPAPGDAGAISVPIIFGSEGRIELGHRSLRLLDRKGWREIEFAEEVRSHARQAQELRRWLDGELADYRGSGDKACETVAIMMAMFESVRVRGLVTMPLTTKESPLQLLIETGMLPVEKPGKYDIRA